MAFSGINFRATAGYVTDGAGETHSLGEAYPITRGGLTFGWAANQTANSRDRSTGIDRRLAGIVFQSNSASATTFRLDLPNGPGTYSVRLALGDNGGAQNIRCLVRDGTGGTVLATINGSMSTFGEWFDTAGTRWLSPSGWVTNNATLDLVFTASHLILEIGAHSSGTAASSISHLAVEALASPSELSGNATLSPITASGGFLSLASSLTGNATLAAIIASGSLGVAPGVALVPELRNWGGSLQAGVTIPVVTVCRLSTGAQVLTLTNQTTNGSGNLSITNAALVPGTAYMVIGWNADGSQRFAVPIVAA